MAKLHEYQLNALRPLETELRKAVALADMDTALDITKKIQELFPDDRSHHRLLRAKLWAFEACVDANRLTYAESGLIGIRKLSAPSTRLYLEASALLAVTLLRQKKIIESKKIISEVIASINNISSNKKRHQFQARFISRVEEECILAELIDTEGGILNVSEVQKNVILFVQNNSEDEIIQIIGNSVPVSGFLLLSDVRKYSIQQLPPPDQKLLPPPEKVETPKNIGRTTFALLRRIAWKTFCKPSSPLYKLWSERIPQVFNEEYFSAAVVAALSDFRIGIPMIASGLAALAMKYSAEEFCELAKPKGLMISQDDKEN